MASKPIGSERAPARAATAEETAKIEAGETVQEATETEGGKLVQPKPATEAQLLAESSQQVYYPTEQQAPRPPSSRSVPREKREIELPERQWAVIGKYAEMAGLDISRWMERHFGQMVKG